jgi:hypothetical protein
VLIDVYASFRAGAEPRPAGDGQVEARPWLAPTGEGPSPAAAGGAPQAADADEPAPARHRRGRP